MIQKKRNIFFCFIDYTKAFDNVKHEKLIQIVHKVGILKHGIRIIANLYYKQMAKIKCNSGMTDNIISVKE